MVIFHSYVSLPEGNGELMLIELKAFSGDSMGCYGNTMEITMGMLFTFSR
jgi:hypothetical protein